MFCTQPGDHEKSLPIILRVEWFASKFENDFFQNELQSFLIRGAQECKNITNSMQMLYIYIYIYIYMLNFSHFPMPSLCA